MKVLLLALALLFTGAHANFLWQNDKPHEENSLWNVMENAMAIGADAIKNLDYLEIAEKFHLQEKLDAAKNNKEHMEKVFEDFFEELWERCDEKLTQNFPVFKKNVYPHLKKFDDHLEAMLKKSAGEMLPVATEFFSGLGEEAKKLWVGFSKIAEDTRDKLRVEIDDVRTKVQPYAAEVKAELEKYKESIKSDWEDKAKNAKDEMDKDLEKFKESFEKMRKLIAPHAEEVHKKLEYLLREYIAIFTSDNKD